MKESPLCVLWGAAHHTWVYFRLIGQETEVLRTVKRELLSTLPLSSLKTFHYQSSPGCLSRLLLAHKGDLSYLIIDGTRGLYSSIG